MLREAIELIQETAVTASEAQVVLDEPRQKIVLLGDELKTVLKPPPLRNDSMCDLASLIRAAGDMSVAYHADERVMLLLDPLDRLERVVFLLPFTQRFTLLRKFDESPCPLDQKSFCRLLKFDLGIDAALIAPFRKLDWDMLVQATGETTHTRDRLGKTVTAEVTGAGALPEDLMVATEIYDVPGERDLYHVRCAIEIDAAAQRLLLRPFPGEIAHCLEQHQRSIAERLVEALGEENVFYGTP